MKKKNKITLFVIPIILVIGLLVVQAFCDLELPEYTSEIINNGIQQNGIDSTVPKVLTEDIYNAIVRITEEDSEIIASYDLVVKDNLSKKDLKEISEDYPLIKKENLYILKDLTDEQIEKLEEKITKPLIMAVMFKSNNEFM